jgi:phosphoenolpyruvate carboxylase
LSAILTQEIDHLTGRLDAIIREQAGELVFHHLDQIRRLTQRRLAGGADARHRRPRTLESDAPL